jgi:hypothetical protein
MITSSRPTRKRTHKAIVAVITCMTAFVPTLALAASAIVSYGFSGGTTTTAALVTPKDPGTTIITAPTVFKSVQTSTEIDTTRTVAQPAETAPGVALPVETVPGTAPAQTSKSTPKIGIGIDALMSNNLKVYTIPLSYTINRNFAIQANIPIVTAKFEDSNATSNTNTGIGDMSVTLKHRIGSENATAALFTLVTTKFATGNADKGLGTGSYDITLTEKVIKRFGGFRGTLMAGVTQPLNKPTILNSEVEYGTTLSYMAAVEHTIGLADLWFGVRAEGLHAFESKIDRIAQGNALTTLDLAPELKYYFKRNVSVNLGANIPVYTNYATLQGGASNTRDPSFTFGVSMMF